MNLDLAPAYEEVVKKIFKEHIPNDEVWAFGSRVRWMAKDNSDLDLVIVSRKKTPSKTLTLLKLDFENSDLPIKVDILDWKSISKEFQKIIKEEYVIFQEKKMNFNFRSWEKFKLSEITTFLNAKKVPLSGLKRKTKKGKYRYYGVSGVVDYIDDYTFDGKYFLISKDGENLKTRKTPIAFVVEGKYGINDHVHILDEKKEGILDYLENYFRYLDISPYITGAVQPKLNKKSLEKIKILLPKRDDRLKINKVANNFKLKIEINNKINNILESLAQTIFKSWFIDFDPVYAKKLAFDSGLSKKQAERVAIAIISGVCNPKKFVEDFKKMDHLLSQKLSKMNKKKQKELAYMASLFPGEFEDSDLGEIPKGFNVCRIDQILELAYGKSLKKSNRVEGSYPVYNSEGRSGVHNVYSVKGPGIILGRKGTTGSLYWEDNNFFPVDTTFFIKPRKSYKLTFIFYLMQTLGLEKMNTNALTLNFNRNNVYKLKFVEFPREIRIVYENLVASIRNLMFNNLKEVEEIEKLRDTLLPRLLEGKIGLSDIQ